MYASRRKPASLRVGWRWTSCASLCLPKAAQLKRLVRFGVAIEGTGCGQTLWVRLTSGLRQSTCQYENDSDQTPLDPPRTSLQLACFKGRTVLHEYAAGVLGDQQVTQCDLTALTLPPRPRRRLSFISNTNSCLVVRSPSSIWSHGFSPAGQQYVGLASSGRCGNNRSATYSPYFRTRSACVSRPGVTLPGQRSFE